MKQFFYRIYNQKTKNYAKADIKIRKIEEAFHEKGEFFLNLKNVKIHIGHCKSKNDVLYNEYMKNCIIEKCEVEPASQLSITTLDETIIKTHIVAEIKEPKDSKIIENSIVNDVATQVTEKTKDSEIIQSSSISGSGNNAVY